jgi:medium-chain acyl-[acyl-carrier-protein] hydrolase
MSSGRDLWVTTPKPNDHARLRLFCFPYAGAGALAFRPWADAFDDVEVCPIQLPGRETRFREALLTDLDALVSTLTGVLYPYHLERPFAFFGHSLGAILAFELTRSLIENYNLAPAQLFVSGRLAPHEKDPRPLIHTLPDVEFVAMLRSLNGTPDEVLSDPEMRPVLAMLRADLALNEKYVYVHKDPLRVPITAFGGKDDPKVTEQELARWSLQTTGRTAEGPASSVAVTPSPSRSSRNADIDRSVGWRQISVAGSSRSSATSSRFRSSTASNESNPRRPSGTCN